MGSHALHPGVGTECLEPRARLRVCAAAEARAIVTLAEAATWRGATINADLAIDRTVRDADVVDERAHSDLTEGCRERLFAASRELAALLAPATVLAEVQIVRYRPGGQYLDHRDSPAPGATPRALSLVWYLNDDFSGGATRFAAPEIAVAPEAGIAVAFAPELMHRAEPVTAGSKYAITAWYHRVPLAGQA